MVSSGVVWCLKNDQWVPLQLSSIILHGALTQKQWAAISDFLKMVANQQVVVQDTGNGLTELSEQQKAVMQQQLLEDKLNLKLTDQQQTLLKQLGQQNVQFCVKSQQADKDVKTTDKEQQGNNDKLVQISSVHKNLVFVHQNNQIASDEMCKVVGDQLVLNKSVISPTIFSKNDQWQNLVIQENGLIKLLNGKTELVTNQDNLVSDNKKLIQLEESNKNACVEKLNNGKLADTEANKQMVVLQFNGQQENKNEVNNIVIKDSKVENKTLPAKLLSTNNSNNDNSVNSHNSNLFINNLFQQTEPNSAINISRFSIEQKIDNNEQPYTKKQNTENDNTDDKKPDEHDEIVARLLQKYHRYNQQAISDKLLNSITSADTDNENPSKNKEKPVQTRTRKYGNQHDIKLYENFSEERFDNERNEHVLRWLKEQNLNNIPEEKRVTENPSRRISVPCGTILGGRRVSIGASNYPPKNGFRRTSVPSSIPRSRKNSSISSNCRNSSGSTSESRKSSGIFSIDSIPESQNKKSGWLSAPQSRKTSVVTPPDPKNIINKEKRRFSVISFNSSNDNKTNSSANSSPDCGKSRKDSVISTCSSSRKGSVISNSSFSEDLDLEDLEDQIEEEEPEEHNKKKLLHWPKILKKHLGNKTAEKKIKRQREAWSRNTRKLSSGSETYNDLASEA